MATRFYFHAASSGVSGTLPSTEQSTISENGHVDAQTVNRSMSTSIGTSEATLTLTTNATVSAQNYYITKFVSPLIYQTSISANTWVYAFSAMEGTAAAQNWPVSGTNKAVYVNIYVWRPSNGSLVGTIRDGTSAATVDEASVSTKAYHIVNVTGSAVNNVQNGDVIIIEIWFQITQGGATSYNTNNFYYDGTTVYAENGSAASAASYLETPETLALTAPQNITKTLATETLTISEGLDRTAIHNKAKSLTTETLTITEPNAPVIQSAKQRIQTTETLDITESVSQEYTSGGPKNITKGLTTETLSITESSTRQSGKWRRIG